MRNFVALFFIVVLGIILRFYLLGSNPPSLDWDEVSMGYNAYSILKTGADEYGNFLPLSIRSFDDYKPAMYTYLAVPSVALFGLNEFAVRFPSALFGVLTILVTYFLTKEILRDQNLQITVGKLKLDIALIAAFLLAISPWHLQFSRAAFEGNIGVFFFTLGLLFFFKGLHRLKWLILSALFFVGSLYSYHSFRLVVPMLLLSLFVVFWKDLLKNKIQVSIACLILIICSIPIYKSFVMPQGAGSRLSMVTIFTDPEQLKHGLKLLEYDKSHNDFLGEVFHNRRSIYVLKTVENYLSHFDPGFLFIHGDSGRHHHALDMGVLYLWDLPFLLAGVFFLLQKFNKRIAVLYIWLFIAPLASAIATGAPHAVRAIPMIPILQILIASGVVFVFSKLFQSRNLFIRVVIPICILGALFLNTLYYLHQYYVHTPIEYGDFWQYGYKEAFSAITPIEDNYDKIVVTYRYDQPYVYYLFYRKIDPAWYQKNWDSGGTGQIERMVRKIGKYEFRNIEWDKEVKTPRTLYLGTPNEIPYDKEKILKEIKFPNGEVAFRIVGI